MNSVLIATRNPGKFKEISSFLSDLSLKLVSLTDLGIDDDIEEDGMDYYENSKKKAIFYSKLSGLPSIADDGGLEIDALGGKPGINSRRWLGHESTDPELIEHMKKVAKELPDHNRTAYFKTVITLALASGKYYQSFGKVKGIIAKKPNLKFLKGYPYRSFFFLPDIKKYYHEKDLSGEEMRFYNHRYSAIQKIRKYLMSII